MENILLKSMPPQAAKIYRLLENTEAMSAKDIGKRLHVFPNAVYRAVKQLLDLGFVEEVRQYPVKFRAKPLNQTIALYTSVIRQNFHDTFGSGKSNSFSNRLLQLGFIRTRTELFKFLNKDISKAKSAVNIIASGLEVPPSHLLALKNAIDNTAKARILVQRLDEVSKEMFDNWQKMRIEVKYYPIMEARIFVIDHQIVHFTSYNPKETEEAIGMRFDYAPYAAMMDELFEQRWKVGKDISGVLS